MQIQGNFDVGMRLVKDIAIRLPVTLVNSVNPYRLDETKPIARDAPRWFKWAAASRPR